MSHWGFPQTEDPIWREHYRTLSKREKAFYAEGLPRILRAVHIGVVSRRSIPYIIDRLSQFEPVLYDWLADFVSKETGQQAGLSELQDYLRRYYGFYVLIPTLDNDEYVKLLAQDLLAMSLTTYTRMKHWELAEVRAEVQAYVEARRREQTED